MINYKTVYKSNEGRDAVLKAYDEILSNWPLAYEETWLDTSYGRSFTIQCGKKELPPLILLHGTNSNSSMWIGDVSEYSKHYCVYALDIPGEPGKSEERQYSLKSPVYFEWLNEILEKLQLSKASILGISLGAWLAAGFSIKYPEKVEKLVLLSPSGIGPQRISFVFKTIFFMMMGDKGFDKMSRMLNNDNKIPKEALEYTKLLAHSFNLRREPVPIFTDQELKRLTMPLLLFAGKKDVLLKSEKTVKRLNTLVPSAVTNLLPDHGHVLVGFSSEIVNFLNEKPHAVQ